MWRREERLKYWLEGGGLSQTASSDPGLKERILFKLRFWQSAGAVKEKSLSINANTVSLDSQLTKSLHVTDGLGILGQQANPAREFPNAFASSDGWIRNIEFGVKSKILDLSLPSESCSRIRQEKMIGDPIARSVSVNIRDADIGLLEPLYGRGPEVKEGKLFLIPEPPVQILTSQISELPHVRASVRIDRLQDSERKGFLHEAEVLKGIPAERAELFAVFRHVPIEVVSRLRLLTEQKAILYTISRERKPVQTRVHDMAAVRDKGNQEVYLIPHRTQYRSVSLN
jgi:hypothetical protein